jgi:hypothetical protein
LRPLRPVLAALASALVLGLAACGADDAGSADALDGVFSNAVPSADVTFDLRARFEGGEAELRGPFRLRAEGPYVNGPERKLPSFDWDVTADAGESGVSLGVISTGDNAWVEWMGTAYEVGEERIAEVNRHIAEHPDDLGLDPSRWIVNPQDEGEEDVAGVDTNHWSADIDVGRFLDDLDAAAGRMGRPADERLTPEERRLIVEAVDDAEVNVWVGQDDDILRRLTVEVDFTVPEEVREPDGVESGEIDLLIEMADVGGDQASRIQAPASSRPIEELFGQLPPGGPGMLPDLFLKRRS